MKGAKLAMVLVIAVAATAAILLRGQPVGGADAAKPASFSKDVKPFLQTYCINCHGNVKPKGGINLETYDKVVSGGKSLVKVGKPDDSRLVQVCEGKGKPMPPKKEKQPTAQEIQTVRAWIADGAKNN
jgi:uncharacterized membrane protein